MLSPRPLPSQLSVLLSVLLTVGAGAAPTPQSLIDRTAAPTDATQAAACVASTDKSYAEIEQIALDTAMGAQRYAVEGMGDPSKITPAVSEAMAQLMTEPYQTCATMMPAESVLSLAPLQQPLLTRVEALREERDRICAAQPNQGESGCDVSAANRAVRPKALAAGNAYYASAAPLLGKFRTAATACIARREAVVDKLMPVGGMMAMQAVNTRAGDFGVAGVWVGMIRDLCKAAEDAKEPFRD